MQATRSSGGTDPVWDIVCPFWHDHVRQTAGCLKCTTARDSPEARTAYKKQGVNGRGSNPGEKDACCLYTHSIDPRRLAEKAMDAHPEQPFTSRTLVPLAKRFMKDNMRASPLGTPHPGRSKHNYQASMPL